jgi:hypothetical protein
MAIDPVLNAAILVSINALQTATLIPSPMTKDALIGAIMAANATVAAHTYEQVAAEMNHILPETPVTLGVYTRPGYTQAALEALS